MFSIMPLPIFKDYLPAHHNPTTVPSPLSSSPIRASSPPQPLSPRDANERRQIQSSPIKPSSMFKYASRPARPNPVARGREGFQEARRNLFLKKLQSAEWFEMDRARRQAKMLDREGMITESDIADAEGLYDEFDQCPDDMMADAMLQEEEAEFEALISSSGVGQPQSSGGPGRPASPHWSDDDYDALFMDLISEQENQLPVSSGDVEML
ncbi:hypothetical protein RB594_001704 [Gaeumannomyces avenae]